MKGTARTHVVIAAASDGHAVAVCQELPSALADELQAVVANASYTADPSMAPASLERCRQLVEAVTGSVEISRAPSYVTPPTVTFASSAVLIRSDGADVEPLRSANPGNWGSDEWDDLLDGALGPWAMAINDGRVVAICHAPVSSPLAAEAGVWTHPDHRGRGLAAAVTAAWAAIQAPTGRRLFYSTSADNNSSRHVAQRLALRPIGWLWKLSPMGSV